MAGALIADSFVSAVIGRLVDEAHYLVKEEIHLHKEMKAVLIELQSVLEKIQALIVSAEGRGLTRDCHLGIWLSRLREACYDAEDVLDEYRLKILSEKINGGKKVRSISSHFMNFKISVLCRGVLQNLKVVVRNLQNLKVVVRNLERIFDDVAKYNLELPAFSEKQRPMVGETSSFILEEIVGRDYEREMLVKVLLSSGGEPEYGDKGEVGSSSGPVFDVLSLVGMGGVGKTTLAQLVYNDERVKKHFDTRLWCYVSDNFDIKRILKSLWCILSGDLHINISDIETIIMELKLALSNKKFLIVFDDVWVEEPSYWEMLRNILTCGARGSKVVVTTRSEFVAGIVGTMSTLRVSALSEDECWVLFKHSAFVDWNVDLEKGEELKRIGMQICQKARGLPLAVKALGGLLRNKLDENYWRAILESELWGLDFVSEGILSALKLSYQHLNVNLKECFAYCSIFPQDYMFEKQKLVQMWLAQGFIKLDDPEKMIPENIGSQWFDELKNRQFFQPAKGNRHVMHDLIRDLAISVSLHHCFVVGDESENIPYRVCHLAVMTDKLDALKEIRKCKSLRTILFFGNYDLLEFSKVLEDIFKYLKNLRVLDLSSTAMKELPNALGRLSHLRYLDISNTKIRLLPTSFTRLCHLQVLNLQGCHFQELPKGMDKLINLRYLYGDSEIVSLIKGIGQLTNLRNLQEFPVRRERGHEIGELKNLRNLEGRLSIKNLENVQTKEAAMKAELNNKMHLNALQLEWSPTTRNRPDVEEEVLEGLQPHPNLTELSIIGYDGIIHPNWMVGNQCLVNLVQIHLKFCSRWENLPSFGQLPFLRILHFENMPALTRIGDQFYGNVDAVFPSLEQLTFQELKNLKEWSEIDRHRFFPCLHKIQIMDCWSLTKCPFLSLHSSVEELIIDRCGDLSMALPECLQSFTSLTLLVIAHYHHKTSLTLSNLNALEKLCLRNCPELSILGGLQSLVKLKKLQIEGCPKLCESSLPKQPDTEKGLHSLTDLCIDDSILLNDGWFLLGSLSSLRILNFQHFNHLAYFSKEQELWFHQLTSIQELGFSCCHKLECLPAELSTLLSLEKLGINNCPEIMSLPENGLPISLKELQISGCPVLEERCSRYEGHDWPKIAHIPRIRLSEAASQKL